MQKAESFLTAHVVSHEGLANNHKSCKQIKLDTAWKRRFSGSAEADSGRGGEEKDVFL